MKEAGDSPWKLKWGFFGVHMGKVSEICKNYLKWANFTLGQEVPRYNKILLADAIAALIYSVVSIFLIWKQEADEIVLGLNILCVIRTIISNKLSAFEITNSRTIDDRSGNYSHYHNEALSMCVVAVFSIIIWFLLILEYMNVIPASVTGMLLMKITATIAILIVLGSEWEDMIVYAYKAEAI